MYASVSTVCGTPVSALGMMPLVPNKAQWTDSLSLGGGLGEGVSELKTKY